MRNSLSATKTETQITSDTASYCFDFSLRIILLQSIEQVEVRLLIGIASSTRTEESSREELRIDLLRQAVNKFLGESEVGRGDEQRA